MQLLPDISLLTPLHWILACAFSVAWLIQLYDWLRVFSPLVSHRPETNASMDEGVSVIICARNEADNLERFLPTILAQDYPLFEVIVVDDASGDRSPGLLAEMAAADPRLRFTSIPPNGKRIPGKKLALTLGLKAAKYERILLTDADCYPESTQWLRMMSAPLGGEVKIVLGYGRYEKRKGLLNLLIRYETLTTAVHYLSRALRGKPYMGVGRNMAYSKSHFFAHQGFASHYHISSGDDDLFVNETGNSRNTTIECRTGAHTWSLPASTFREWWKQKQRHLAVGKHYKRSSRWKIAAELGSRIMLYICLLCLCFITPLTLLSLTLFLILLIARSVVLKLAMRRLDEKYLLLPSLLFDPLLPFILGLVWMTGLFATKNQSWR